jgi:hypothetical protein
MYLVLLMCQSCPCILGHEKQAGSSQSYNQIERVNLLIFVLSDLRNKTSVYATNNCSLLWSAIPTYPINSASNANRAICVEVV